MVRLTPTVAANSIWDSGLQGLAKTIRSGETPRAKTDWISARLAQSKLEPRAAMAARKSGLGLHLTA